jgi:hypothetical protein
VSEKTKRPCGAVGLGNRVDVSRLSRTEAGLLRSTLLSD